MCIRDRYMGIWVAYDCSEEKPAMEKLCARFITPEEFKKFKEEFDKAYEFNLTLKKESSTAEKKPEEQKTAQMEDMVLIKQNCCN
eukprot:TRINITY_DN2320_c0_g1_i1.p4 TRINITY_DN2320_c0_g1~~TRINITY_DN2320_c0_g1_i1.p4  ORF type:complete len:100 (-),score=28.51 TRINITY_DN2320_c0_g1_i1:754-1008(-)